MLNSTDRFDYGIQFTLLKCLNDVAYRVTYKADIVY